MSYREDSIERYHDRVAKRLEQRADGGIGSGNWGHVGRIGEVGGSAPGGGLAYRIENTRVKKNLQNKYTSQAKMRDKTLKEMKSKKARISANAQRRSQRINMGRKSRRLLEMNGKFDANASRNILAKFIAGAKIMKQGLKGTRNNIQNSLTGVQQPGFQYGNVGNPANANPTPPKKKKQKTPPTPPAPPKPKVDPLAVTHRPTDNANYNRMLGLKNENDRMAFYAEAKQNGKLTPGDTSSSRNVGMQKLVNYVGMDGKPDLVDDATFNQLSQKWNSPILYRGVGGDKVAINRFKTGANRMGGGMHGSGIYFGCSLASSYGPDIQVIAKPDAKILVINEKSPKDNAEYNQQHQMQWCRAALMRGYDAVRILGGNAGINSRKEGSKCTTSGRDYMMIINRRAFVAKK